MSTVQELSTKEKRIKKELAKYKRVLKNLEKDKKKIAENLMQNAAFMAVTLEDLQVIINEEGCVEEYQNGANQSGKKESTASQAYNKIIKNYMAALKQMCDLMPQEEPKDDAESETFKKLLNM